MDLDQTVQQIINQENEKEPDVVHGLTVTEWVLVAATAGWTGDGNPVNQVIVVPSDAPAHRLWGLVRDADARFNADALETYGRTIE